MKKYTVTLRNRNNLKVTVGDDEAIIDAVENIGHLLPIACRYGGCITCAAKLIDGKDFSNQLNFQKILLLF